MTSYDRSRKVEAKSFAILQPWLEEASGGRYVLTTKGRLARVFQEQYGDVLFNSAQDGRMWTLELKAEEQHTGNLFLETWSNRNLENPAEHAKLGCNPGWLVKQTADLLLYHFLDNDTAYLISLFKLKQWSFGAGEGKGRIYAFPEVLQGKYHQKNDTWGRLVEVRQLMKELPARSVKKFHPRQLEINFGVRAPPLQSAIPDARR